MLPGMLRPVDGSTETMMTLRIASPKRSRGQGGEWYPYYAGFSAEFADEALRSLDLPRGATILDPWNGSGTTTTRSVLAGHQAVGVDINPAMALIAAGRLAQRRDVKKLRPLASVVASAEVASEGDPLCFWFGPGTAGTLRAMASRIIREHSALSSSCAWQEASASAVYFAGLGLVLRALLRFRSSTNPTWHRQAEDEGRRIRVGAKRLAELLDGYVRDLEQKLPEESRAAASTFLTADCRQLPLAGETVDAVVTSPPYCTRLDYPIAMQPELALLGQGPTTPAFRELRVKMHGTPTIRSSMPSAVEAWGDSCQGLLSAINSHASRASSTYYYKVYAQYFDDLHNAFAEVTRVCRRGSSCVIVVQSSWYKEIPVPLPDIVTEMLVSRGWCPRARADFPVRHTLADTNPASTGYRSGRGAVESAIEMTLS